MTSRDTGRWVIPKGWPMGEKPGPEVAAQEALEEAGLVGEVSPEPIGKFDYRKALTSGLVVPCEVRVYGMRVTGCVAEFKEAGQRQCEWISPSEAARRVAEPGLAKLIHSFDLQLQLAG